MEDKNGMENGGWNDMENGDQKCIQNRILKRIGLTGDTVGCVAKHLTSWGEEEGKIGAHPSHMGRKTGRKLNQLETGGTKTG